MNNRCQYAQAGTYGHECGDAATTVLVTVMSEETKTRLRSMGASDWIPADGLSRSFRCATHRGKRELGQGQFVRTEVTK